MSSRSPVSTTFTALARRRWMPLTILAILVALTVEAFTAATAGEVATGSVLGGDVAIYEERWRSIVGGTPPYADGLFEHLPLMLLPIGLAGLLSEIPALDFRVAFVALMAAVIGATTWVVRRTGDDLDEPAATARWLVLTVPLLPLVLLRLDAVPVLFAAAAVMFAIRGRELTATGSAALGILAKGWPVLLAVTDWWRGRKRQALFLLGFTVVVVATLLLTPGFRAGRSFSGVHQESLTGSIVLLARHISGRPLGFIGEAGAVYLDVGRWVPAVNLVIGGTLAVVALFALRRPFTWHRGLVVLSALTLATLLASPLLSAQFLFWPTAFLALIAGRRSVALFAAAAIATTVLFGYWAPEEAWWAVVLVGRNAVLLVLAASAALAARSAREQLA